MARIAAVILILATCCVGCRATGRGEANVAVERDWRAGPSLEEGWSAKAELRLRL